jgi:lipopolysaccharide export system protein LptA
MLLAAFAPLLAQEEGFQISGDSTSQTTPDILEFAGHVKVTRKGLMLAADRVRLERSKSHLLAEGNVVISDPSYSLTCGRLSYHGGPDVAFAFDAPRLTQVKKDAAGETLESIELAAFQINVHPTQERVEALERVRISRFVRAGAPRSDAGVRTVSSAGVGHSGTPSGAAAPKATTAGMRRGRKAARRLGARPARPAADGAPADRPRLDLDFRALADALDFNLRTHRAVLKGKVTVESPTYNVEARRLVYDSVAGRFTAVGDATVVGFDSNGNVSSTVAGNKIVHFLKERRSMVLGGVSGEIDTGATGGRREISSLGGEMVEIEKEAAATARSTEGAGSTKGIAWPR